jgi:hypothetical protein
MYFGLSRALSSFCMKSDYALNQEKQRKTFRIHLISNNLRMSAIWRLGRNGFRVLEAGLLTRLAHSSSGLP